MGLGAVFEDLDGVPAAVGSEHAIAGGAKRLVQQSEHTAIVVHRQNGRLTLHHLHYRRRAVTDEAGLDRTLAPDGQPR